MDDKYLIVRMYEEYQLFHGYARSLEIVKIVDSKDEADQMTEKLNDEEISVYTYYRHVPLSEGTDLFSNLDLEGWFTFDEGTYRSNNEGKQ